MSIDVSPIKYSDSDSDSLIKVFDIVPDDPGKIQMAIKTILQTISILLNILLECSVIYKMYKNNLIIFTKSQNSNTT